MGSTLRPKISRRLLNNSDSRTNSSRQHSNGSILILNIGRKLTLSTHCKDKSRWSDNLSFGGKPPASLQSKDGTCVAVWTLAAAAAVCGSACPHTLSAAYAGHG